MKHCLALLTMKIMWLNLVGFHPLRSVWLLSSFLSIFDILCSARFFSSIAKGDGVLLSPFPPLPLSSTLMAVPFASYQSQLLCCMVNAMVGNSNSSVKSSLE